MARLRARDGVILHVGCVTRFTWATVLHILLAAVASSDVDPFYGHPVYRGGVRCGFSGMGSATVPSCARSRHSRRLAGISTVDLQSWTLDMNAGTIYMEWNSGMDVGTLNYSAIIIQTAQSTRRPGQYYRMQDNTTGSVSRTGEPNFSIVLGKRDMVALQQLTQIATSKDNSWLTLDSKFILDMAAKYNEALVDGNAMQAQRYMVDYTPPSLLSYDLDMAGAGAGSSTVGFLTLRFDEVVNTSSLDVAGITIRQFQNYSERVLVQGLAEGVNFTLSSTSSYTAQADSDTVVVTIGQTDLDQLKLIPSLATNENNTFVTLERKTIKDMTGLEAFSVNKFSQDHEFDLTKRWAAAMQVTKYTADNVRPQLIYFALDTFAAIMRLTFDETVNTDTLAVTKLSIQTQRTGGNSFTLPASSTTPSVNRSDIIVQFDKSALQAATASQGVAKTAAASNLVMQLGVLFDPTGNPTTEIPASAAWAANTFIEMGLKEFTLNVHVTPALLTLSFDASDGTAGTVRASTLNVERITLQSNAALDENVEPCSGVVGDCRLYTLTTAGSITTSLGDVTTVTIEINDADLDQIKLRPQLAVDGGSTYLACASDVLNDPNGNDVSPKINGDLISPPIVVKDGTYVADETRPTLMRYNLNMNTGVIRMLFSEAMNVSSLNVTMLTLQAHRRRSDGVFHTLTSATLSPSPNGIWIELTLSRLDLNFLKTMRGLAVSQAHTYLVLLAGAINDMVGNKVNAIPDGSGMLVDVFTADTTSPLLTGGSAGVRPIATGWFADFERGVLLLTFSEPVDPTTFHPNAVTIASNPFNNGTNYTLSNSSYALLTDPMSAVSVLRETATTYKLAYVLSTNDRSIYDLDFAGGVVYNEQALRLQKVLTDPLGSVEEQKKHAMTAHILAIQLSFEDLNNMATMKTLATSSANTFLFLSSGAVRDMAGNDIVPIRAVRDGVSAAVPSATVTGSGTGGLATIYFNKDSGRPYALRYDLDMDSGTIRMYFSEAVDVSTLDTTKLRITQRANIESAALGNTQAATAVGCTLNSVATSYAPSTTSSIDGTIILLQLGKTDLHCLKRTKGLAKAQSSTYLLMEHGAILDMAGHKVQPIQDGTVVDQAPMMVSNFTRDATAPTLVQARADLSRGLARLTFSEPVDLDTFDVTVLQVQEKADASSGGGTVLLSSASKIVDPTVGDYCMSLASASDALATAATPRLIYGGTVCSLLLGQPGVSQKEHPLFEKNVDVHVALAAADVQRIIAAWDSATRADQISTQNGNIFVSATAELVRDFALPLPSPSPSPSSGRRLGVAGGNPFSAVSPTAGMAVATIICIDPCPLPGQFVARPCSELDDRICTSCTVCTKDHWTITPCSAKTDTVCHRCTSCAYGKFVVRPCGGGVSTPEGTTSLWTGYAVAGNLVQDPTVQGQDTLCRRCRDCNHNTFETRRCEYGLDRLCQTCDSCTLDNSPETERKCRGQSWVWRRINCCWDTQNNQVKPCKDLPLEEFKISAMNSRRDEVWCYKFNRDKKQCEDEMYQNGVEPLGGHIDETEFFDGTSTRYKEDGRRIHLQDTNIPVQSYGDAADTNRVIPATAAPHESDVHPGRHARQQTGTQNVDTNKFAVEVANLPTTGVADAIADANKFKILQAIQRRYPTPKGFNTGY